MIDILREWWTSYVSHVSANPIMLLDPTLFLLGWLYLWFEYRASWWVWVLGIIMPALDIVLYHQTMLYGDMCLSVYYLLAAVYGLAMWKWGGHGRQHSELEISLMPGNVALRMLVVFFIVWGVTYYLLANYTNSNVPVTDALTNAISIIGMWAMARKYLQQWFVWITVDFIDIFLYSYKDLPFKAAIHVAYIVVGVLGFIKWRRMMQAQTQLDVVK